MNKKTLLLSAFLLLIFSCSQKEDTTPQQDGEALFEFEGKWIGTWTDDRYSYNVSTEVTKITEKKYSGEFYAHVLGKPYTSAWGGTNDGHISFEVKGDSVINYLYKLNIPTYKGSGSCTGTFTGNGLVNRNTNRLFIKFEGNDCDGFHENGQLVWRLDK